VNSFFSFSFFLFRCHPGPLPTVRRTWWPFARPFETNPGQRRSFPVQFPDALPHQTLRIEATVQLNDNIVL
jgi:hypothetical protein